MSYLSKLEPLIKCEKNLELAGIPLRNFVSELLSNYSSDSGVINVYIGTFKPEKSHANYEIIIGEKSFTIEKNQHGLSFYLSHVEVEKNLPEILDLIKERLALDLNQNFLNRCEKTLKEIKNIEVEDVEIDRSSLNQLIVEVIKTKDLMELKTSLNQLDWMVDAGIKLVEATDIPGIEEDFPVLLVNSQESFEFCWGLVVDKNQKFSNLHLSVLEILSNHFEVCSRQEKSSHDIDVLELAVEHLANGLVVLDERDNIRVYNQRFFELSIPINRLQKLGDKDFLKIGEESYQVNIRPFKTDLGQHRIYIFNTIDDQIELGSANEELGIVCSSLAHELNNPLAGILASLTVIELDDENGALEGQLSEMKKGVLRCKQLVETFLGFSKSQKMHNATFDNPGLQASFDQALELMRFRMIEADININLNFTKNSTLEVNTNFSVMVMIGYLFLGELTTSLSHYNLLTRKNSKTIDLKIVEGQHGLHFSWTPGFPLSQQFLNSMLFIHLMESQHFQLKITENGLTFKAAISDLVESETQLI